jgi:hypothetical protein
MEQPQVAVEQVGCVRAARRQLHEHGPEPLAELAHAVGEIPQQLDVAEVADASARLDREPEARRRRQRPGPQLLGGGEPVEAGVDLDRR